MLTAQWARYGLDFRFEAVTSRERMWRKPTYFVRVFDPERPETVGIGECPLFPGLSADDRPDYEAVLTAVCRAPESWRNCIYPSIRFGFETAMADLAGGGLGRWTDTPWSRGERGVTINGLVWMGDKATMSRRIREKLDAGFRVLKLKIGGIAFDDECGLLEAVRREFSPETLEIRLDANGSFAPADAMRCLDRLARYGIHSIEQPVKAGQPELMARLCRRSPLPIALDEELIGWRTREQAEELVGEIMPAYLILKPALIGGTEAAEMYAGIARQLGIGWWATSALESNVGLNAIAQWVATTGNEMPQGLGTGQLYTNNIASPLELRGDRLFTNPGVSWGKLELSWQG